VLGIVTRVRAPAHPNQRPQPEEAADAAFANATCRHVSSTSLSNGTFTHPG